MKRSSGESVTVVVEALVPGVILAGTEPVAGVVPGRRLEEADLSALNAAGVARVELQADGDQKEWLALVERRFGDPSTPPEMALLRDILRVYGVVRS